MEQELGCKFISIDPDKEDFNIFKTINEIFRHIQQSDQKTLTSKISTRLLGLEFKLYNIIKSKPTKIIVKKYCLIIVSVVKNLQKTKIRVSEKLNEID